MLADSTLQLSETIQCIFQLTMEMIEDKINKVLIITLSNIN